MSEEKTVRQRKVEAFKEYLTARKVEGLIEQDWGVEGVTAFRSNLNAAGQQLPFILTFDDSVYTLMQILVVTKAKKEENEVALLKFVNRMNRDYTMLKYLINPEDDLVLTVSIPAGADKFDPSLVIGILDEVIKHLDEEFRNIMKVVWKE